MPFRRKKGTSHIQQKNDVSRKGLKRTYRDKFRQNDGWSSSEIKYRNG